MTNHHRNTTTTASAAGETIETAPTNNDNSNNSNNSNNNNKKNRHHGGTGTGTGTSHGRTAATMATPLPKERMALQSLVENTDESACISMCDNDESCSSDYYRSRKNGNGGEAFARSRGALSFFEKGSTTTRRGGRRTWVGVFWPWSSRARGQEIDRTNDTGEGMMAMADATGATTGRTKKRTFSLRGRSRDGGLWSVEKEERAVWYAKFLFLVCLGAAALGLCAVVYALAKGEEADDFDLTFQTAANEVLTISNENVRKVFRALEGLATTTTSFIKQQGNEHHFVTIPDLEEQLSTAKNLSGGLVIAYLPKVYDLDAWSSYSSTHQSWIDESNFVPQNTSEPIFPRVWKYEMDTYGDSTSGTAEHTGMTAGTGMDSSTLVPEDQGQTSSGTGMVDPSLYYGGERHHRQLSNQATNNGGSGRGSDGGTCEALAVSPGQRRRLDGDEPPQRIPLNATDADYPIVDAGVDGEEFYTPVWQISPPPDPTDTSIVNYNLLSKSIFRKAVNLLSVTKQPALLDLCNQATWFQISTFGDILQTVVVLPVFDKHPKRPNIDKGNSDGGNDDGDNSPKIVGYWTAIIPLRVFFEQILSDGVAPIRVVLENDCNEVITFELQGPKVLLITPDGDEHYSKHSDMALDAIFAPFVPSQAFYNVRNERGEYEETLSTCRYVVTVYPTKQMADRFLTNDPIWYTAIVLSVFIITSILFIVFDIVVQRRQDKVMTTARKQDVIVSSLFPRNFQAKILAEVDEDEHHHRHLSNFGKAGLKTYLTSNDKSVSRLRNPSALSPPTLSSMPSFTSNSTNNTNNKTAIDRSKPIADLFPETTIMFGDISGFTAWSSTREPSQVFTLLETIYHEFDVIAKRRRVFKVEVVGDCYVAVCGLPDPRQDHAVVMARFANECLTKMHTLTQQLEVALGPDTNELVLRVGLHSGPVVAGVLRGEKSRFQLFGDTMNTASRMESTGIPDKVQLSQETADLLAQAGKSHWCIRRLDKVSAKGKGELQTYFLKQAGGILDRRSNAVDSSAAMSSSAIITPFDGISRGGSTFGLDDIFQEMSADSAEAMKKRNRLADWTVKVLGRLLRKVAARRRACNIRGDSRAKIEALESALLSSQPNHDNNSSSSTSRSKDELHRSTSQMSSSSGKKEGRNKKTTTTTTNATTASAEVRRTVIDEVEEIIILPAFDEEAAKREQKLDQSGIELDDGSLDELREYVQKIASLYNNNAFHNFAHATHVTMSVVKLLGRIAAPDLDEVKDKSLHDHTYGITSDPLTRFAVVFSALIHDVDHEGVSNVQLVKEQSSAAAYYNNKSVAEQNSVDLAWDILMEPKYKNLRRQIYTTEAEFKRFRKLVVNSVMATDILDEDLKRLRNNRWDAAFDVSSSSSSSNTAVDSNRHNQRDDVNRKATIVIEHLIQASDVAHTMQHWDIYRKWNTRLFHELYHAHQVGRLEHNPTESWYEGEIGFFDYYIIPLAKKLKECGVFGVSSDEYLLYAQQNRKEWEQRGKDIVAEMSNAAHRRCVANEVISVQQQGRDEEGEQIIAQMTEAITSQSPSPPYQSTCGGDLESSSDNDDGDHDDHDDDDEIPLKRKRGEKFALARDGHL